MLSSYRQLKKAYALSVPQARTQHFGAVSTSKTSRTSNESPELIRYLELGEKVEKIEQAVDRVGNNEYLKNKYMIADKLTQWQLAELSGYGISRYNDNLRVALLNFAIAYGIIDISLVSFKIDNIGLSRA
ncbi:hypothetical protein [Pseudolactococcus raffinolactis]|uniref:hypothetical protein n=1 Tax=Pseudolactococcus raffinolactis TaxID=1366 RepID=UPI001AE2EB35|nr:hypothetical protein [Lactococcus raffinolactis]